MWPAFEKIHMLRTPNIYRCSSNDATAHHEDPDVKIHLKNVDPNIKKVVMDEVNRLKNTDLVFEVVDIETNEPPQVLIVVEPHELSIKGDTWSEYVVGGIRPYCTRLCKSPHVHYHVIDAC